jgi:hypothetical protein
VLRQAPDDNGRVPARLLVFLLAVYAACDFANPLMPGAVCFDAEASLDGLRPAREAGPVEAAPAGPAPRVTAPVARPAAPAQPRVAPTPPARRAPPRMPPARAERVLEPLPIG